jgi:hypothetical protein
MWRQLVDRFGWWLLAAIGAVLGTGPLLILGPFGLALLAIGGAALFVGVLTEKGAPKRTPVVILGAVWLVLGVIVILGSSDHTTVSGTGVLPVHQRGPGSQVP